MKNYLQKQAAKSLFVHCRKRQVSVSTLRMSATVRQSSSFHILTSFAQVDADAARPRLSAELDCPRFLRPKRSIPNLYEIQDLY